MSQSQFQKYLADNGRAARRPVSITPACWPHTEPMRPTIPVPGSSPVRLLNRELVAQQITQYRAEASRLLARAQDLENTLALEDVTP